jgi:5-oxopent-3-ene-1,2,5-tricarboxylate decarboxylase/2-hydroxyhepta-2,4-diene-1,7-dioate isomerase
VTVAIDGVVVQHTDTGGRVRSVAQLLADVTEFMTLNPGDILSIGVAAHAPLARAGQRVAITIEGVGQLENILVAEELV